VDLDLVVEGDALGLARELAAALGLKATAYETFGTATIETKAGRVDLAMARTETYARPAALPEVRPATIAEDLGRRDFTINAMAIGVSSTARKGVLDLHGGEDDLQARLVRVLHERSFQDDPTRMFRALRYAFRLGFRLEDRSRDWLRRDLDCVGLLSAERIRHELDLMLQEPKWQAAFEAADRLGLLHAADPALCLNRQWEGPASWQALLPAEEESARELVLRLQLPRTLKRTLFPQAAQPTRRRSDPLS
jgi:tRNA nucleotidyltransferase (CCA-adding enzyme)